MVVHKLSSDSPLSENVDSAFLELCDKDEYYDSSTLEDGSTQVGGTGVKRGFANSLLPLVLSHNTPNNSVSLLWAYEHASTRGLFPRIPRHKEIV